MHSKIFNKILHFLRRKRKFRNSTQYWKERYALGGNSGAGSYNKLAEFKAEVINGFLEEKGILTVAEFGCGDGNQLKYLSNLSYVGYDVSDKAIKLCRRQYKGDLNRKFFNIKEYKSLQVDLTLSLDVIYHLVEDEVFENYMQRLFDSSSKYVIVYSTNSDNHENNGVVDHVKHREFTKWVLKNQPGFRLIKIIPNKYPYNGNNNISSYADFYFFEK